jgi:hypothetical protein
MEGYTDRQHGDSISLLVYFSQKKGKWAKISYLDTMYSGQSSATLDDPEGRPESDNRKQHSARPLLHQLRAERPEDTARADGLR